MYSRVIIPTDGSELSFKGVKEGLQAARSFGIPAVAVYVLSPGYLSETKVKRRLEEMSDQSYSLIKDRLKEVAKDELEKVKKYADRIGVKLETKILEGIPYEEITNVATEDDIIFMSSHGRSGFSSLFIGSTTDRVIKHTNATVAVVKA